MSSQQSSLVGFQKSVLMSTSVCESTNEQIIAHPRSQNASDVLCFVSSLGFPNCTFSPVSNFFYIKIRFQDFRIWWACTLCYNSKTIFPSKQIVIFYCRLHLTCYVLPPSSDSVSAFLSAPKWTPHRIYLNLIHVCCWWYCCWWWWW